MERKTRFELATLALARRCSTPEPLPHVSGAGGGNSPGTLCLASLSLLRCDCRHLAARKSTGLSHDARALSGSIPCFYWSWWRESNPQPADYKSAALPLSHTSKIKLALHLGLEPRTYRLTAGCSTIELMKRMINTAIQDYHTLTNNASIIFTFFDEFHEFLL